MLTFRLFSTAVLSVTLAGPALGQPEEQAHTPPAESAASEAACHWCCEPPAAIQVAQNQEASDLRSRRDPPETPPRRHGADTRRATERRAPERYGTTDCWVWPGPVVLRRPAAGCTVSTASYEVVPAAKHRESTGYWKRIAVEKAIDGEYVEVYHPAVYEQQKDGTLQQIEPERTVREPKTRVILKRVWVEGDTQANPPAAEASKQP